MKIGWKNLGKLTLGIVSAIVPAVGQVEQGIEGVVKAKGSQAKQDAALVLVQASVAATEAISNKDLLDDGEVMSASRAVIDAVVHLQNVEAKKTAALEQAKRDKALSDATVGTTGD